LRRSMAERRGGTDTAGALDFPNRMSEPLSLQERDFVAIGV
jgi:hypothetical protein